MIADLGPPVFPGRRYSVGPDSRGARVKDPFRDGGPVGRAQPFLSLAIGITLMVCSWTLVHGVWAVLQGVWAGAMIVFACHRIYRGD